VKYLSFIILNFLICISLVGTSSAAFALDPPKHATTFYTEIYPPANFFEEGKLKGITVDTLKAIWKEVGYPEQEINIVPWARGFRFTLDKSNSALFTMSRTPPREKLFKWVGPIFNSTHVLMAKKSKRFSFTKLSEIFNYKIAAVRGDISEISLNQVGFPDHNMAKVSEIKLAFKMMKADRVDMIVTTIHGFDHLAQQLKFSSDDYEQVWQVNKYGNYIAFNNQTPDSVINLYQNALNNISKQHQLIKEKYKLSIKEY